MRLPADCRLGEKTVRGNPGTEHAAVSLNKLPQTGHVANGAGSSDLMHHENSPPQGSMGRHANRCHICSAETKIGLLTLSGRTCDQISSKPLRQSRDVVRELLRDHTVALRQWPPIDRHILELDVLYVAVLIGAGQQNAHLGT